MPSKPSKSAAKKQDKKTKLKKERVETPSSVTTTQASGTQPGKQPPKKQTQEERIQNLKTQEKKTTEPQPKGTVLSGSDLVVYAAVRNGLSKPLMEKALNALLEAISESLGQGGEVRLMGFGTFSVRPFASRRAFNPQTKEAMTLPPGRRPVFRAGSLLKAKVK